MYPLEIDNLPTLELLFFELAPNEWVLCVANYWNGQLVVVDPN